MPTSSCTCRAERPEMLATPPGGSWPTTPNTGTGNCAGSISTPTAAGRLPSEGESYAQSAHSELIPRQGGFPGLDMTVRGSPPEGSRAPCLSDGEGLLDLAVAVTAGDHQRGAAVAVGPARGGAHAPHGPAGVGGRPWPRGG